ncbi:cytochrome c biogenesis protein DipZ [Corynebacterium diphtheriae bv. mitis]|uniref:cytochrome c biogenesis protein DipZ n=1 Tax=Corynebacterium diphtheriae TaxID=1717 RepID=UPI0013CA4D1D|nr:cytochrome c biogenesis protein DipZ [Corynebacterium diphtheriae]MBG9276849.1 cytochrome c biogenesis protein DipZ [Corynebacterium diphtheriae bv. mitis]MBG9281233.1 cytochrome c biogenesis protein DipZ [Corynebacterium diphtheriae bv. mitis]CAB0743442.1 cytochrome c biogenesis protein DipZ [Corynebacterium diphtheriae]CAB0885639.1 cytochrome c biogenesis protein DipZ [Corynebacterium diphtheriae]CAB0915373.1 cytochrome c biogenesis protein DipZ [Corynebacterium diphtheriae]
MFELATIGLIGGIVTGISPCILPVLPVVLAVSVGRRPTHVVAGLALSFATITLLGTVILSSLGLPKDVLRWTGIGLLVIVGLSMMIPKLGELVEEPFSRIPRPTFLQQKARDRGGFMIGLALGAVYVPCAGPILAAITVAGATGDIGWPTVVLTVAFAVGASLPLLVFALAGNKMGEKIDAIRKHMKLVGAVILALALAMALNIPERVQRAIPDWTAGVQKQISENDKVRGALSSGGGSLAACRDADPSMLHDCGEAPEFEGLTGWFNTDKPVSTHSGQVTLVDFWAYACINCQRAGEHITKLYDAYRDAGLQVVGVHAPEYGFEHELANVKDAAKREGINYPVAQDNDFVTWKKYNNRYWPARYLIDAQGNVRHIHEGEGAYKETEQLVRELLREANPQVSLPEPVEKGVEKHDAQLTQRRNPETYLGYERARYFTNSNYGPGERTLEFNAPKVGQYTLSGTWEIASDHINPVKDAALSVNIHAATVQTVVSGTGTLEVTYPDGHTKEFKVADGTVNVVEQDEPFDGILTVKPSQGVSFYSLTFG